MSFTRKTNFHLIFMPLFCLVSAIYGTSAHSSTPTKSCKNNCIFSEGSRYKIKNLTINGNKSPVTLSSGGKVDIEMDILHDCVGCGNAINQVIVGLSTDDKAQVCVWNGKQKSGGRLMVVNPMTNVACLAQDKHGKAEWVKVYYSLDIPCKEGTYHIRSRYAQAYTGNIRTEDAIELDNEQPRFEAPLKWWKVDRPNGPTDCSTIGTIHVVNTDQ